MTHNEKVLHIIDEIDRLFADTTVTPEDTYNAMARIADHADIQADTIRLEIEESV